jgi:hypothetical protein
VRLVDAHSEIARRLIDLFVTEKASEVVVLRVLNSRRDVLTIVEPT